MNAADDRFSVAFICTGNRFRSPLAAALLRRAARTVPVDVSSAGVLDVGGSPVLPEALRLGRTIGVDLAAHRSRHIASAELHGLDLVLGFELQHAAAAVVDAGAPIERTFGVTELLALVEQGPIDAPQEPIARARAVVVAAHERRAGGGARAYPSVLDPLGQPPKVQQQVAAQVDQLVRRLAEALFGPAVVAAASHS